ncbi:MAG: hypothetical protein K2I77_01520 [Anaeroplasmataceae bacterium]|nr:hypothetical protein [Anaeroplasmataceae bacterium]
MRTKKIEKQINKIINEADQVPNYVLNQAKTCIKWNQKQEKNYPIFRRFSFRMVAIAVAFILLIFVVSPIVIVEMQEEPTRYGDSGNRDEIRYSSLDKEEISSIEQYNLKHHTNYFSFKDLEIDSSYLLTSSSIEDFIMLEETYSYQDGEIKMYLHDTKYSVNMDSSYLSCQKQDFVKEIEILSFFVNEHITRIYFRIGEIGYYITMEDIEDYRSLLVEMIQG